MIATLFGWTKLPQWALELIVIAAVAGGIFYWQHHEINKGIALQKAADDAASQPLLRQAAEETATLKSKATMAEQTHAKEIAELTNRPDPNKPVRLCLDPHGSGQGVRPASAANSGNKGASTPAISVQPVPDGNPASGAGRAGPDIEPMLTALAARADELSAELREVQARGN